MKILGLALISVGVIGLIYNLLMLYRNKLVFRVRKQTQAIMSKATKKHLALCRELNRIAIYNEKPADLNYYYKVAERWRGVYRWYEKTSYESQMYDLRKWKFEDFYPDLEEVIEGIFTLQNPRRRKSESK